MERTDIIKSVWDLKCEVLKEIRKVLPNGTHQFVQPFYIHYIEGEVATTEVCKAIEVCAAESQMVKVHHQSEGYGAEDIDITDGEEVMQYEPQSFADILGNLKAEIRGKKLSVLRNLIEQNGGKMQFDGSFTFIGMQEMANGTTSYFDDTKLFGMEIVDGKLSIDDMWDGDSYQNDEEFIDFDELDRIIEYVRNQSVRTFQIHAQALVGRVIDVQAASYEDAVELAKKELELHPFTKEDIDGIDWSEWK